jgi:hypothetical protein
LVTIPANNSLIHVNCRSFIEEICDSYLRKREIDRIEKQGSYFYIAGFFIDVEI